MPRPAWLGRLEGQIGKRATTAFRYTEEQSRRADGTAAASDVQTEANSIHTCVRCVGNPRNLVNLQQTTAIKEEGKERRRSNERAGAPKLVSPLRAICGGSVQFAPVVAHFPDIYEFSRGGTSPKTRHESRASEW